MQEKHNIVCVFRSGGDFTWEHVRNLKKQLDIHVSQEFQFSVLSDLDLPKDLHLDGVVRFPLIYKWPGFWSKIELFRCFGKAFYIDLDTIIVGNIDHILSYDHKFTALRGFYSTIPGFRGRPFGSGLMSWTGNFKHIWKAFAHGNPDEKIQGFSKQKFGDQEWIGSFVDHEVFQDLFPAQILSYKLDVQKRGLINGTRIVCFHGRPRIQDVNDPWVSEAIKPETKINYEMFYAAHC